MTQLRDIDTIQNNVPHRFEILLIDSFSPNTEVPGSGDFSIHITSKDPLNRELFTENNKQSDKNNLISTTLVEMMALGSILNTGQIPEGHFAFFAAISKFEKEGSFHVDAPIEGKCELLSEKANFHRYKATLTQGKASASSQLMAFFTDGNIAKDSSSAKIKDLPSLSTLSSIQAPTFKSPHLWLIETLLYQNTEEKRVIFEYTYPTDHPCTKGHFPGNPVMMGVMQWLMVEDALSALIQNNTQDSNHSLIPNSALIPGTVLRCHADILLADGTTVCEIKNASALLSETQDSLKATLASTQKVLFREMVKPGQRLLIDLTLLEE